MLLFHRLRNGVLLIPFNLDVLDIDVANEITTLQQDEAVGDCRFELDFYAIPLFGKIEILTIVSAIAVGQVASHFSMHRANLRTFDGNSHFDGLACLCGNVLHCDELYVPIVGGGLFAMDFHTIVIVLWGGVDSLIPANRFVSAENFVGNNLKDFF